MRKRKNTTQESKIDRGGLCLSLKEVEYARKKGKSTGPVLLLLLLLPLLLLIIIIKMLKKLLKAKEILCGRDSLKDKGPKPRSHVKFTFKTGMQVQKEE